MSAEETNDDMRCIHCGNEQSIYLSVINCSECSRPSCIDCFKDCVQCDRKGCPECLSVKYICDLCGQAVCINCNDYVTCQNCDLKICFTCKSKCDFCDKILCHKGCSLLCRGCMTYQFCHDCIGNRCMHCKWNFCPRCAEVMTVCQNLCGQQVCQNCIEDPCTHCFVSTEFCAFEENAKPCGNVHTGCYNYFCANHAGFNACFCSQCGVHVDMRKEVWFLFAMHCNRRPRNGKKRLPLDLMKLIHGHFKQ